MEFLNDESPHAIWDIDSRGLEVYPIHFCPTISCRPWKPANWREIPGFPVWTIDVQTTILLKEVWG
jgi:hypothetical protein